jgi:hypothetical protein
MKTFRFPMANDIVDRSCKIRIDGELPDFDIMPLEQVKYYYETKGRELFLALALSIPQGILDALFVELCRDKASIFKIARFDKTELDKEPLDS